MASTTATPAPLSRKLKLIWMAFVSPQQFVEEEEADSAILNAQTDREPVARVYKVRSALWGAFLWCVGSLIAGSAVGISASVLLGAWVNAAVGVIVVGTLIVLWATLALLGWEIRSWSGVTLGERVNLWIYRILYSLGTALMVAGSIWSLQA